MSLKSFFLIVITAIVTIIVVQNNELVNLKVLFWEFQLSKLLLILCSIIIGLIVGIVLRSRSKKNNLDLNTNSPLSSDDREFIE